MIRTFPNPTAAEKHARENPIHLDPNETLRRVVVEQFGAAGYALRVDVDKQTGAGKVPFCRYVQKD